MCIGLKMFIETTISTNPGMAILFFIVLTIIATATGIYKATNASFSKMFSFATVIGISKLIGYEVRNISATAFAVEQKIPVETTMSKLILNEE